MNLAQLQEMFWHAARGEVAKEKLDRHFVARPPRTGAGRMRIYNVAYFKRLEDALEDSFPITKALLGPARFQQLARRYIIDYPSEHPALERVGSRFSAMLGSRLHQEEKAWADVAKLEHARINALLAPLDPIATDARHLASLAPETVRLRWVRSLALRKVSAEAAHLWLTAQGKSPSFEDDSPRMIAFYRRGMRVEHRILDAREGKVLWPVRETLDLVDLCSRCAEHADPAPYVFQLLQRWLAAGWVADLELIEAEPASTERVDSI